MREMMVWGGGGYRHRVNSALDVIRLSRSSGVHTQLSRAGNRRRLRWCRIRGGGRYEGLEPAHVEAAVLYVIIDSEDDFHAVCTRVDNGVGCNRSRVDGDSAVGNRVSDLRKTSNQSKV